jgi:hypothetical protein
MPLRFQCWESESGSGAYEIGNVPHCMPVPRELRMLGPLLFGFKLGFDEASDGDGVVSNPIWF